MSLPAHAVPQWKVVCCSQHAEAQHWQGRTSRLPGSCQPCGIVPVSWLMDMSGPCTAARWVRAGVWFGWGFLGKPGSDQSAALQHTRAPCPVAGNYICYRDVAGCVVGACSRRARPTSLCPPSLVFSGNFTKKTLHARVTLNGSEYSSKACARLVHNIGRCNFIGQGVATGSCILLSLPAITLRHHYPLGCDEPWRQVGG